MAWYLLGLFVILMIVQAVSTYETFAATSPGTLTQLVTSRPVYYLAVQ